MIDHRVETDVATGEWKEVGAVMPSSPQVSNAVVPPVARHEDAYHEVFVSRAEALPTDAISLDGGNSHIVRRVTEAVEAVLALAAIMVAAPAMVLIMLLIFAQDGGPPIFVQRRIGRGGVLFPCLKFRSMVVDSQAQLERLLAADSAARGEWATDQKLRSDPRITPLGSWLRKTSLDELPQLFNIVAGHMSLVGPRPIVRSEVIRYGRYYHHYCSVRPGLTGLWQVSGRSNLTYRRRVVIDTVYVRSRTLAFDTVILFRTVPAMLTRRGSV